VVVASIFAYTVLSAGLFSSQKSQEAVYSSLKQTQGTNELKGAVIATAENIGENGYISQISFTLANAMGGDATDFTPPLADAGNTGLAANGSQNRVTISYIDMYQKVDDLYWTLSKMGSTGSDNLLDKGEKFQITIGNATAGAGGGNLADALSAHHLGVDTQFAIEVKSPSGATLSFERYTPATISAVMNLN
jgi:flagellin FlaB